MSELKRRSFLAMMAAGATTPWTAKASRPPRVLVVGGGPAGLSAALTLAENGAEVTLLEASEGLGGKMRGDGDIIRKDGPGATVYSFWEGYRHTQDLMERHGIGQVLENAPQAPVSLHWASERGHPTPIEARMRLFRRYIERAHKLGHALPSIATRQGRKFLKNLDTPGASEQLMGRSVIEWQKNGAPLTFFGAFSREMAQSHWLNNPGALDAATFARGERFYGTAGGATAKLLAGNLQAQIWTPLGRRLEALGGKVRVSQPVDNLVFRNGRVTGVLIGKELPGAMLDEHPGGWFQVERLENPPLFIREVSPGRWTGLSGRCSHCAGDLEPIGEMLVCAADGARFNLEGQPQSGPARHRLNHVLVEQGDDGLYVDGEDLREEITADAVVLAVPVPVLKRLSGHLLPQVEELESCRATIGRFYFDTDVSEEARVSATFMNLPSTIKGFLLHRIEPGARRWATAHNGSVIEIHSLGEISQDRPYEEVLALMEQDVRAAWPELSEARLVDQSLSFDNQLTWYKPGWQAHALPTDPGIAGLRVCGDHVLLDASCQHLEKAVLSGRLAANGLLERWGLPQSPVFELT